MRKGKRFTPARLQRWQDSGRGAGTQQDYVPFHQVSRDDPGSRGRSHLINWRFDRQHHLLSDQELVVFGFITMLPNLVDVREQFPLAQQTQAADFASHPGPLVESEVTGTVEVAAELGLKHPRVNGGGASAPWVMTSDFVVTLAMPNQRTALLVISVKADEELEDRRTLELLRIEREYWRRQDVTWLLVTPSMYGSAASATIKSAMAWAVRPESADDQLRRSLARLATKSAEFDGHTLPAVLDMVRQDFEIELDKAQALFWTAVWMGLVPLDLSMAIRPGATVRILDAEAFLKQNPVASRRTAWKN